MDDPHVGMAAMLASGQRRVLKIDEREQLDFEARCLKAEARVAELEARVEAGSRYIDRIPTTWRMDIDLARELLHERGLTEEYEQRRLDYLRQLGYAEGVDPSRPPTESSEQ